MINMVTALDSAFVNLFTLRCLSFEFNQGPREKFHVSCRINEYFIASLAVSVFENNKRIFFFCRHKHRSRRQQSDAESELSRGSGRSGRRHRRHRSRHKHESGSERDDSQPDTK